MAMEFIRASDILDVDDIRHGVISKSETSTIGEFHFIPGYCKDCDCDCRKSEINVVHEGKVVAVIEYAWESEVYYSKRSKDGESEEPQSGATIKSKDKSYNEEELLALFNRLMNSEWKSRMVSHYGSVKKFYDREKVVGLKPWQRLKVRRS